MTSKTAEKKKVARKPRAAKKNTGKNGAPQEKLVKESTHVRRLQEDNAELRRQLKDLEDSARELSTVETLIQGLFAPGTREGTTLEGVQDLCGQFKGIRENLDLVFTNGDGQQTSLQLVTILCGWTDSIEDALSDVSKDSGESSLQRIVLLKERVAALITQAEGRSAIIIDLQQQLAAMKTREQQLLIENAALRVQTTEDHALMRTSLNRLGRMALAESGLTEEPAKTPVSPPSPAAAAPAREPSAPAGTTEERRELASVGP